MGPADILLLLNLLTLCLVVCRPDPVIDVDVSSAQTSYAYAAGRDSEGQEYRCVVNGNASGLSWRYNGADKGNPLNAYQFYGQTRLLTDYTIECYVGSVRQGAMTLTLLDDVKFTVTYSGNVGTYSRAENSIHTVLIPANTQNIVFACEVNNGVLTTPIDNIGPTMNPSVTLAELTDVRGEGPYSCFRFISSLFVVLQLSVRIGVPPTTLPPTITNTTTISTSAPSTMSTINTTPTIPTTNTTMMSIITTMMNTTAAPTTPTTPLTTPSTTAPTTVPTTPTTPSTTVPTASTVTTESTTTPTLSHANLTPASTSPPSTAPNTSNATSIPLLGNSSDKIIIGFCIIGMILLFLLLAGCAIGVCLWRHYAGFKKGKYLQQMDDSERNGSVLREIVGSPKQFLSAAGTYYEPLNTSFNDDSAHSQAIPLGSFKQCMDRLWDGECLLLNAEYSALGLSELRHSTEAAREHISDGKNRYKNIYPYDKSRVHLHLNTNASDYVNASYIPGVAVQEVFIACQAPKKETMLEFWEMLWQKQISNVVMLTRVIEGNKKKCEPYFPEKVGETLAVGDIYITLVQSSSDYNQTIRVLEVKTGRDVTTELKIRHFHFSGWPDHEAPRFPHGLINFIKKVKREMIVDSSPMCCHCSAGVGRTGTFIALYNLMEDIKACRPISVFRVVNDMREHRPHMVQTFTQYKFLYLACLELIHGETAVPAASYTYYYNTCLETPTLQKQLEEIEYFCEKYFDRSHSEALNPRHANLNPDTSVLPFDDYRPVVSLGEWGVGEYINASYVDGFQGFQDLIATQHPNAYTARSTVQLIFQTECPLVVVLASRDEHSEMGYEHGRIIYWPEPNTQHEFDGFILKNMSMVQKEIMEYVLLDTVENTQHRFNIIISLHWGNDGAVTDKPSVLGIVNEMISVKANFPTKPIIVQCKDGAGKSGVLISLYNTITQATQEQRVDVFHTVKCLRFCRPRLVRNLAQYQSIHSLLHLHLAANTYENLS